MTTGVPSIVGGPRDPGDVRGRVLSAARALHEHGITAGDRVVVCGDNSAGYVVAVLALACLDASLVPVDHRQSAEDVAALAARADAKWLICDDPAAFRLPGVRAVSCHGLGEETASPGRVSLDAWFARRDAVILWSSGTTGRPKGVVKSGRAIRANTLATIEAIKLTDADVLAPLLPFSHQYGLSVILLWWLSGATLLITPYLRPDLALEEFAGRNVTVVDATPGTYHVLLRVLARRPELRKAVASVRMWGVGGAPLPASLARSFREEIGRPLLDGYGMSELGNIALATEEHPDGCGLPLPGVEVRVVDGEIEVRSPGMMEGYLDHADPVPISPDGWYRTGDLGSIDDTGILRVIGRKHAVHRAGFTVYPESLERRAERCGRPVKVVPVEDPRLGASLHFVVADEEGRPAAEWRRLIVPHLAEYEHPNAVHVVEAFPLNHNGKVDLTALREMVGL